MRSHVALAAALLVLVPGCKDEKDSTAPVSVALHRTDGGHSGHSGGGMRTTLSGAEEIPQRVTPATGMAVFRLSGDGTTMSYELDVRDIRNVMQAHIHETTRADGTGGIVVWLYGSVPANMGEQPDGRLAAGQFTARQFVGTMAGKSMEQFLAALREGKLYVNVHTNDGAAPPDTGPGDFPGGEIRGVLGDKDGGERND